MENFKKISRRIKKRLWYLLNKPMMVLLLIVLFCIFLPIFYFLAIQRSYYHEEAVPEVNPAQYERVLKRWESDREKFENLESKKYFDIFSEERRVYEEDVDEIEKEDEKKEEENSINEIEDFNEEDFSAEEIEEMLARTIYQFYEKRGMGMPQISERAQVWEDFQLGSAEEYKGLYEQNVLLLRKLKEKMERTE